MSPGFRGAKSYHGIATDILKSGLQKYTRRGMTNKALWCGVELDLFAYSSKSGGETIRTNVLHRIMIIFIEDISVANLGIWPQLDAWMDILWTEKKNASP